MRWMAIAAIGLVAACSSPAEDAVDQVMGEARGEQSVEELQARVDQLEAQLEDAQSSVDDLIAASQELTDEVSRFDDTNWRAVVPAVREHAEQVESRAEDVRSRLDH